MYMNATVKLRYDLSKGLALLIVCSDKIEEGAQEEMCELLKKRGHKIVKVHAIFGDSEDDDEDIEEYEYTYHFSPDAIETILFSGFLSGKYHTETGKYI